MADITTRRAVDSADLANPQKRQRSEHEHQRVDSVPGTTRPPKRQNRRRGAQAIEETRFDWFPRELTFAVNARAAVDKSRDRYNLLGDQRTAQRIPQDFLAKSRTLTRVPLPRSLTRGKNEGNRSKAFAILVVIWPDMIRQLASAEANSESSAGLKGEQWHAVLSGHVKDFLDGNEHLTKWYAERLGMHLRRNEPSQTIITDMSEAGRWVQSQTIGVSFPDDDMMGEDDDDDDGPEADIVEVWMWEQNTPRIAETRRYLYEPAGARFNEGGMRAEHDYRYFVFGEPKHGLEESDIPEWRQIKKNQLGSLKLSHDQWVNYEHCFVLFFERWADPQAGLASGSRVLRPSRFYHWQNKKVWIGPTDSQDGVQTGRVYENLRFWRGLHLGVRCISNYIARKGQLTPTMFTGCTSQRIL